MALYSSNILYLSINKLKFLVELRITAVKAFCATYETI